MSEERKDIKADFEDFVSEKDPVPRRISEQILAAIHRQIYPSRTQLFLIRWNDFPLFSKSRSNLSLLIKGY